MKRFAREFASVYCVFIFCTLSHFSIETYCIDRPQHKSRPRFFSTLRHNPTISNMKQRNVSSITSVMLLVLVPYLFNARIGTVKALDDLRAPFIKSGQQQSDEMMWAQFSDEKYEHVVSDLHTHMMFMFLCFAFNI